MILNFNDDKETNDDYIDTTNYGNYYRPKAKKKDNSKYIVVIVLIVLLGLVLLFGGFLTTIDKEEEYRKLLDRVCDASIQYVSNPIYRIGIDGADIPGRIVYIVLNEVIEAGLIEPNLIDFRTGDPIAPSTDIRLEVVSADSMLCSGFSFPEDDRIIPEVFLIGNEKVYLKKGETFLDPGSYAIDNRDGNITNKIVRSGTVDYEVEGEYNIYYVVRDRAGNQSKTVTRTIIVN